MAAILKADTLIRIPRCVVRVESRFVLHITFVSCVIVCVVLEYCRIRRGPTVHHCEDCNSCIDEVGVFTHKPFGHCVVGHVFCATPASWTITVRGPANVSESTTSRTFGRFCFPSSLWCPRSFASASWSCSCGGTDECTLARDYSFPFLKPVCCTCAKGTTRQSLCGWWYELIA
jgi:hypothetical protein